MTAFLTGCDPAGLRRVQLRLPAPAPSGDVLAVDQPKTEDALQTLDAVVAPIGFKMASAHDQHYLRVYVLSRPPVIVEGRTYSRDVPIRVSKTATGIEVAFGEFGLLGGTPEIAVRAFKDTRAAFTRRYGRKSVRTKTFGAANQSRQPTPEARLACISASLARRGCAVR